MIHYRHIKNICQRRKKINRVEAFKLLCLIPYELKDTRFISQLADKVKQVVCLANMNCVYSKVLKTGDLSYTYIRLYNSSDTVIEYAVGFRTEELVSFLIKTKSSLILTYDKGEVYERWLRMKRNELDKEKIRYDKKKFSTSIRAYSEDALNIEMIKRISYYIKLTKKKYGNKEIRNAS